MSKIYPNKFVPFILLRITIFKSEFEISLRNVKLEHENHNKRSVPGSSGLSIFFKSTSTSLFTGGTFY